MPSEQLPASIHLTKGDGDFIALSDHENENGIDCEDEINKCRAVLKTGARAGEQCGLKTKNGTAYCGRHAARAGGGVKGSLKSDAPNVQTCRAILKTGARAGEECGSKTKDGALYCRRAGHGPPADQPLIATQSGRGPTKLKLNMPTAKPAALSSPVTTHTTKRKHKLKSQFVPEMTLTPSPVACSAQMSSPTIASSSYDPLPLELTPGSTPSNQACAFLDLIMRLVREHVVDPQDVEQGVKLHYGGGDYEYELTIRGCQGIHDLNDKVMCTDESTTAAATMQEQDTKSSIQDIGHAKTSSAIDHEQSQSNRSERHDSLFVTDDDDSASGDEYNGSGSMSDGDSEYADNGVRLGDLSLDIDDDDDDLVF